jgi:hypothetical protein
MEPSPLTEIALSSLLFLLFIPQVFYSVLQSQIEIRGLQFKNVFIFNLEIFFLYGEKCFSE